MNKEQLLIKLSKWIDKYLDNEEFGTVEYMKESKFEIRASKVM